MFCTKCGTQLEDDALFCSKCGSPTTTIEKPAEASTITTSKPAEATATKNSTGVVGIIIGIVVALVIVFIIKVAFGGIVGGVALSEAKKEVEEVSSSVACENAKTTYTAVACVLTMMEVTTQDDVRSETSYTGSDVILYIHDGYDGYPECSLEEVEPVDDANSKIISDMEDYFNGERGLLHYLSEDYNGYGYALISPEDFSVKCAWWSKEPISDEYLHLLTEDEIRKISKGGQSIGCYPVKE